MELKDFIDNQMGKNKDTIIRVGQKSGDKQIKAKNLPFVQQDCHVK